MTVLIITRFHYGRMYVKSSNSSGDYADGFEVLAFYIFADVSFTTHEWRSQKLCVMVTRDGEIWGIL